MYPFAAKMIFGAICENLSRTPLMPKSGEEELQIAKQVNFQFLFASQERKGKAKQPPFSKFDAQFSCEPLVPGGCPHPL